MCNETREQIALCSQARICIKLIQTRSDPDPAFFLKDFHADPDCQALNHFKFLK